MHRGLWAVLLLCGTGLAQTTLPLQGGYSAKPMLDVDGDGLADYVVGNYNSGEIRSGATGALIRSFGPFMTFPFFCGGEAASAEIDDVDGDGLNDVAFSVPADCCKYSDPGKVWAFSSATGLLLWTHTGPGCSNFGKVLETVGDLNQDGARDLIVSSSNFTRVISGVNGTQIYQIPLTGRAPAALGDITGDGIADLLLGGPHVNSQQGQLLALSGADAISGVPIDGVTPGDMLGWSVSGAADLNGDGVPDYLAGAPGSDVGVPEGGCIYAFSGATAQLIQRVSGVWPQDRLGASCADAGDVDQDGYREIAGGRLLSALGRGGYVRVQSVGAGTVDHLLLGAPGALAIGNRLIAMGDLNLDGRPELGVCFSENLIPGGLTPSISFINIDTGLRSYGTGTVGCFGGHPLDSNGPPQVGNQNFGILTHGALNGGMSMLLLSDVPDLVGTDLFQVGIKIHLQITASAQVHPFAAQGNGSVSALLPIPNVPALIGARFYAQGIVYWLPDQTPCTPSPLSLSSTAGLMMIVQP
ncbi:MAG: VCBS repeat-containing protein [Planctomycetes bacterium]|nr:VCBS repeat-containing protein [Planctomycetota bacterium]